VREVDEEGLVLVRRDELDDLGGVAFGQLLLLRGILDDLLVPHEGHDAPLVFALLPHGVAEVLGEDGVGRVGHVRGQPHVVAEGDAVVVVEPLAPGEELLLVAQVPLAHARGRVADVFEDLGDGDLAGVHGPRRVGEQHVLVHADPAGVAAGHQ